MSGLLVMWSELLNREFSASTVLSWIFGTILLALIVHAVIQLVGSIVSIRQQYRTLNKDFSGPPPHWLYGNNFDVEYGEGLKYSIKIAGEFGSVAIVCNAPIGCELILMEPEVIKVLLTTSEPKDVSYVYLKPWIGDGLLVSQGKKWSRNRRLLTPAFHFDILKPYQKLFSESTMNMVTKWKRMMKKHPDDSIEIFEHVSLMTLDSLMKCIFGLEGNFQAPGDTNPYIKSIYDLSELLSKRFLFVPFYIDLVYYFSWSGYCFRKACNAAHSFTKGVIKRKRHDKMSKESEVQPKKYLDFIDMLLECKDADDCGLSDQEIQDEVDTFMFEGHDTTASGLSWCLYNLAMHPEYQDRCRTEVNSVIGENDEILWEHISKLSYLTMCIKESLRTHPPVPNVGRNITKPLILPDGRVVPANTWLTIAIYALHHNPKVWCDPEIYDPERFHPDNAVKHHSHAFVPFSAGPRNCIGQHFAMNELKTTVALVLRHFQLSVDENKPAEKLSEVVLRSKNGIWLKLISI